MIGSMAVGSSWHLGPEIWRMLMKKLTKAEYQQKFKMRTILEAKRKRLAEARLSKKQHCIVLVIPERRSGQEAACAFLVRKRVNKQECNNGGDLNPDSSGCASVTKTSASVYPEKI